MDKKIANNITVGIFVAVAVGIFIFILFSMGNGRGVFSSSYILKAKYPDVKGLHGGSEVSLSGLRVGVIREIYISKEDQKLLTVELSISKSMKERIRKNSVASIKTQGMLGDKYVEISIGTPDVPPLEDGDTLITAENMDIIAKAGKAMDSVNDQLGAGGDFDSLMKNLNKVSSNLVVLTNEIQKSQGLAHSLIYGDSGAKLDKSMTHIEQILKKVNSGEGTLGALINDPTLYEDIKYLLGGAKRSTILKYFMRSFIESGEQGDDKKGKKEK
jgi:phospholipid/cholesterol/gamma-HCH transport system substrate-binding protein